MNGWLIGLGLVLVVVVVVVILVAALALHVGDDVSLDYKGGLYLPHDVQDDPNDGGPGKS